MSYNKNINNNPSSYERNKMINPNLSGFLSFIVPGFGQIYNGCFLRAFVWLAITPGFWIGSGGTLGWICHFISAYTAYTWASNHNS